MAVSTRPVPTRGGTEDHFTLMIRPHKGFTAKLASKAAAQAQSIPGRILLEGPYGRPVRLGKDLSKVLFIIGGSGISVAVPAIYEVLERSSTPSITLVWAMRNGAMLSSVLNRELRYASGKFNIEAHITGSGAAEAESKLVTGSPGPCDERARVAFERPNVGHSIVEAIRTTVGKVGVVACGPPTMMNDVRIEVIKQLTLGHDMEVWLESFVW